MARKIVNVEKEQTFRPIHYLGSKLRILDFLEETINNLDPSMGTVCDLFAGAGSVSRRLAQKRKVLSVDIQEYSRVICTALLNTSKRQVNLSNFMSSCANSKHSKDLLWCFEPLINYELTATAQALKGKLNPLCDMIENGALILKQKSGKRQGGKILDDAMVSTIARLKKRKLENSTTSLISRYYGGIYFSYRQAVDIDIALEQCSLQRKGNDLLLAAILGSVSNIVNTVGKQFAQPLRPRNTDGKIKSTLGSIVQRDRSINFFVEVEKWAKKYMGLPVVPYKNVVLKMDYRDALNQLPANVKVIYADPPYTRDHYSRYYHVLETICLRDSPALSTMVLNGKTMISRGLYREERHQSPFCIKSQAGPAFKELFKKASSCKAILVISYSPYDESKKSHPRLMRMEQLTTLAKKYYRSVEVLSPGEFSHSKLNKSAAHLDASANAEVLVVCKF